MRGRRKEREEEGEGEGGRRGRRRRTQGGRGSVFLDVVCTGSHNGPV